MFDTVYNTKHTGLGFRDGFMYSYDNMLEMQELIYRREALKANTISLQNYLHNAENGEQQKVYTALEAKSIHLKKKLVDLQVDVEGLKKIKTAWEENPEVAAVRFGLGSKIDESLIKEMKYGVDRKTYENLLAQLRNFEVLKATLEERAENIKKRLSPENIQLFRDEVAKLETEVTKLEAEKKSLTEEIDNLKNAYNLRKETEKLALEQERQQREANAQAVNAKAQSKKQNNTILLVTGAAILVWVLLSGDDKKHVTVTV